MQPYPHWIYYYKEKGQDSLPVPAVQGFFGWSRVFPAIPHGGRGQWLKMTDALHHGPNLGFQINIHCFVDTDIQFYIFLNLIKTPIFWKWGRLPPTQFQNTPHILPQICKNCQWEADPDDDDDFYLVKSTYINNKQPFHKYKRQW